MSYNKKYSEKSRKRRIGVRLNKTKCLLWGLVIIAWMIVIYSFSAMNGFDSAGLTEVVLDKLYDLERTNETFSTIIGMINIKYSFAYFIRKMAHMFIFCVLQIITFLMFRNFGFSFFKSILFSMLIVIGYACTDEFHQLFVPGRSGQITDVMIDTLGGSIGVLIISVITLIKKLLKKIIDVNDKKSVG